MIAGLRAPLDEKVAKDSLIPFDRLFKDSKTARVVRGKASKIDDTYVYSDAAGADAKLEYAYLVLAMGCDWADEIDAPENRDSAITHFKNIGDKIAAAKKIVVLGGGAVGIELAGEIADKYRGQKAKDVTLIHRPAKLLNDVYPDKLRNTLQQQLEALGVSVRTGTSIEGDVKPGELTLSNGEKITADLVLKSTGGKPNSGLMKELDASAIAEKGSIKVNEYFQIQGHPKILAIGDLADLKEQKQAAKTDAHAATAAMNVVSLAKEGKPTKAYGGSRELIIVTVGKDSGAGWLFGFNIGGFFSKYIKSRGLFISQSRKMLAY